MPRPRQEPRRAGRRDADRPLSSCPARFYSVRAMPRSASAALLLEKTLIRLSRCETLGGAAKRRVQLGQFAIHILVGILEVSRCLEMLHGLLRPTHAAQRIRER